MDTNSGAPGDFGSLFGPEPTPTPEPTPAIQPAPAGHPLAPIPGLANPPANIPDTPQAPVTPAPEAQPPALKPPEPEQKMVPLAATLEERHRRQAAQQEAIAASARAEAAERMLQQAMAALQRQQAPQFQQQPIDPVAEPERYFAQLQEQWDQKLAAVQANAEAVREQTQAMLLNQQLNASEASTRAAARATGNEALVDQALEAARASGMTEVFRTRPDPWGEMVAWHQAQTIAREIGSDPAAYRARIEQQAREKVLAELRVGRQPPPNLPPSIATAASGTSAPETVVSSREFFNQMFAPRRPQR